MSSTYDDYSDLIGPSPGSARLPLQGSSLRLQTWPAFWRLIWKEYRSQRGFWLGMVGLVLFGQFVVWTFPVSVTVNAQTLFALALGGAAFYGLGCAATLYSAEQEAKTFERLCLLSASPGGVLASKLSYTIASTALQTRRVLLFWQSFSLRRWSIGVVREF